MTVSESPPIQVKAGRDGFSLVPDPEAPFDSILDYVRRRLQESRKFFVHSEMALDLRNRPLRSDEIHALHALLLEKADVKLVEVKLGDNLSLTLDPAAQRPVAPPRFVPAPNQDDTAPVIVRSTCRSGARFVSPSDCVILGDVNPGAEVVAVGDIIIFGNLRGLAHAGATGDRTARIWALSIEPNQLRIADLAAAVPPRGDKPAPKRFEIAEIQDNLIEVITL
ncbi:MAG: septum site-determining protein MinC [Acidobacteriota bacterium]